MKSKEEKIKEMLITHWWGCNKQLHWNQFEKNHIVAFLNAFDYWSNFDE